MLERCHPEAPTPLGEFACLNFREPIGGTLLHSEQNVEHAPYVIDGRARPGYCAESCCEFPGCKAFVWRWSTVLQSSASQGWCMLYDVAPTGSVAISPAEAATLYMDEQWLCTLEHNASAPWPPLAPPSTPPPG